MEKSKLIKRAILNSLGVLIYVVLVSVVLNNGQKIFGSLDNKVISPIVFLLLLVFSALLTGGLILGKPIMLYLDGFKKEGVKLLIYTGAGLFVWLLLAFLMLFLFR
jgi:hypothetical protein